MTRLESRGALDNQICSSLCGSLERSLLSWQSGTQSAIKVDTRYQGLISNFKFLRFCDNGIDSANIHIYIYIYILLHIILSLYTF